MTTATYTVPELLEQHDLIDTLLKDVLIQIDEQEYRRGYNFQRLLRRKYRLEERKKAILNELLTR